MFAAVDWAFQPDGFLHLVLPGREGQPAHDILQGPLGVLLYLALVPLYYQVGRAQRLWFLCASSVLLAILTLGIGYTLTFAALAGLGLLCIRRTTRRPAVGIAILSVVYALLILFPQPAWLPRVEHPLYFYLHWAGLGYLFLKTVHVLVDVSRGDYPPPTAEGFLAYLFFAPTMRMGPIYRYWEFIEQATADPRETRDFGAAAIRIILGLVRLGVMIALLERFPIEPMYAAPETLSDLQFLGTLYAAPLAIYLWISGYVDIAVGVGHTLGYKVPENFNYPWKSRSLAEFWRRWHLTLGAWLREYIYIPLGGNRRHVTVNYFVTFLFCGLWHGTYLSYVLWGISQGLGLGIGRLWNLYWRDQRDRRTPMYRKLARMGLVGSRTNRVLCWLATFHYQIFTIALFMVESGDLLAWLRRFVRIG
jgi:D-alanyl-lipoteichoic acid acyltransferase DltB (MBOAT superfamily)